MQYLSNNTSLHLLLSSDNTPLLSEIKHLRNIRRVVYIKGEVRYCPPKKDVLYSKDELRMVHNGPVYKQMLFADACKTHYSVTLDI